MQTIVATIYALNPLKGSEDGMGWNFAAQIAKNNKVIAITRKNNREHIEKFMMDNPQDFHQNMEFLYFDLPYWMRFWKKGSRGAMLYYYLWQLFIPLFIKREKVEFDIAHNLNFHNDWTPSLLWTLGKPMVWGPIGHHPSIPTKYLRSVYGRKAYFKDRFRSMLKHFFWNFDPLLYLTKKKAAWIWCMNSSVEKTLNLREGKSGIMPSVASENVDYLPTYKTRFNVLSVGRFVPLKGFDVTIGSFAKFYHGLKFIDRKNVRLTLVGSGTQKSRLVQMCKDLEIDSAVKFIDWIERSELEEIYRQSSLFLFPSHEGAGMVVSEAMSYGLPVLCFDNIGPGEFVSNKAGRKVPYSSYNKSIEEFAHHLQELHGNSQELIELSAGARSHFQKNFAWDMRGQQLLQAYNKVASSKGQVTSSTNYRTNFTAQV